MIGLVRGRIKRHGIKPASGRGPCLSWYVSADIFLPLHFWPSGVTAVPLLTISSLFSSQNKLVIASSAEAVGASGLGDRMCWVFVGTFLSLHFWQRDSKESDGISSAGEGVWHPSPYRVDLRWVEGSWVHKRTMLVGLWSVERKA